MRRKIYPDPVFARNLKKLLAEEDQTQEQLARLLGRERKSINCWINCVTVPTVTDLKKICIEYQISADELMGIEDLVR